MEVVWPVFPCLLEYYNDAQKVCVCVLLLLKGIRKLYNLNLQHLII